MELLRRNLSLDGDHGNGTNKDIVADPESISEKYKYLIDKLRSGDYTGASSAVSALHVGEDVLKSPEIIDAICTGILSLKGEDSAWKAEKILENFWIPKERKPELGVRLISNIIEPLEYYNITSKSRSWEKSPMEEINEISKKFSVSREQLIDVIMTRITSDLRNSSLHGFQSFVRDFSVPRERLKTPQIHEEVRRNISEILDKGYLYQISDLNAMFQTKDILQSPEMKEKAHARLITEFRVGDIYDVERILEHYPDFKNELNSEEMIQASYEGLAYKMKNPKDSSGNNELSGYFKRYENLQNIPQEKLSSPEILDTAYECFNAYLKERHISIVEGLIKTFPLLKKKLSSPEIIDSAYQAILDEFNRNDYRDAIKIAELIPLPSEKLNSPEMMSGVAKTIKYWADASSEHLHMAIEARKHFPIPDDKIGEVITPIFLKRFRVGDIDDALLLAQNFPISPAALRSSEVTEIIFDRIKEKISQGSFDDALQLATNFNFPESAIENLAKEALTTLVAEGKFFEPGEIAQQPGSNHEDEEDYYYDHDENTGPNVTIQSLITKFPFLKEYMESPEMEAKIQEIFIKSADTYTAESLAQIYQSFTIYPDIVRQAYQTVESGSKNFQTLMFLNGLLEKPIDPLLNKVAAIFGDIANIGNYETLKSIRDGNIPPDVKELGVREGGEAGLNQLEQGFMKFRKEMLDPDFDPHILKKSKIARDYFKTQIRFSQAEFSGAGNNFDAMLKRYLQLMEQGEYDMFPMNPAFASSEVVYVDTINRNGKAMEYTESFRNRHKVLSADILAARELYLSKFPLSQLIERISDKVKIAVGDLESKIDAIPNETGKKALGEKVEKLKNMNLRSLEELQNNFLQLAGIKELESDLRQAMFVMGFAKNRSQLDRNISRIADAEPKLDDITWMMNFVDHIVNKETMGQYFTDKQARNKFRELISIKAFDEELSRFQNQDKIGTMPMKFIPTRGILMEFSGHIADACWADKYKYTIPAMYPNFTSVTMVQNPDSKHERICGSVMLIETREGKKDGKPLLLIRGLNPIQNVINGLSVDHFYEKFMDYAEDLAQKSGRKLAIVIDNHSGGSSTNRPMLFNYLSNLKLEKVRVPYRETEFNGYDVTQNAYLVQKSKKEA